MSVLLFSYCHEETKVNYSRKQLTVRHSVEPAEQLDVNLVVVWLERRPLVDQRD